MKIPFAPAAAVALLCASAPILPVSAKEPKAGSSRTSQVAAGPKGISPLGMASFADVLSRTIPSVVTVRVTSEEQVPVEFLPNDPPDLKRTPEKRRARSGGSGVIIDAAKGHILTNNHVIDGAVEIGVVLSDGRLMRARLIGRDIGSDLAVIEVEDHRLEALPIGDSDTVRVGDIVLAIGNPFGLEGTATMGIVSASMRTEIGHEAFEDFFQIDAVINPGNSGGALVNTRGELIGINTATAGTAGNFGIGFAIPINMARVIKDELIRNGRMRRGSLGLIVEDLSYEHAATTMSGTNRGALVTAVVPGSPAAKAGIRPGAIVTEIAGKPVRGAAEYQTRVVTVPLGTELTVGVRSEGRDQRHVLKTAEVAETRPAVTLSAAQGGLAGADVSDIAPGSQHFGDLRGSEVMSVAAGSRAAALGLRAGDVIVGIDERNITDTEHLVRYAERTGMSYRLRLNRKGIDGWLRIVR
ncbi:MAG: trypsin-like peptidase domain-containing protein [Proteobacteria bacterium]|nr:trypsin-like peptidase domain-containing protein [Pseudomonadota bacterium]